MKPDAYYDPTEPRPERGIKFTEPRGFVLRWYSGDTKAEYYGGVGLKIFVESQRDAVRFATAEQARASVPDYSRFGAGGEGDTSGFKVCPIVKTTRRPVPR